MVLSTQASKEILPKPHPIKHRLEYYAARIMIFILNAMPLFFSSWIARRIGDVFYFFARGRKKVGLENLGRVYGEEMSVSRKDYILRKSFQNTAVSILELFLIEKMRRHASEHFTFHGLEYLEKVRAQGKGVVLVTSHLGSWEYLCFLFYLSRTPCSVIVKSLKNPYLNKHIDRLRRATTVVPIPKKKAIRKALAALKENVTVAIVIDQWAGQEGIWVDFMGHSTATTSLPSRLAARTDCALLPAYCLRIGDGRYEIQVMPPLPYSMQEKDWETKVTEKLNEDLGNHIRMYPEQWSWAHRRWKAKPDIFRHPHLKS